jgi:DNA replication protein DnaC
VAARAGPAVQADAGDRDPACRGQPPTVEQVRHLHALIERRTGVGSTIFCSQVPPAKWHDQIEEKVVADAIVDRITANAHKMTLTCKNSLRRVFKPVE